MEREKEKTKEKDWRKIMSKWINEGGRGLEDWERVRREKGRNWERKRGRRGTKKEWKERRRDKKVRKRGEKSDGGDRKRGQGWEREGRGKETGRIKE